MDMGLHFGTWGSLVLHGQGSWLDNLAIKPPN
jgi:hypothetical protein